jgi:hypothetical protein
MTKFSSFDKRLDRLEEAAAIGTPCPECGHTPGGPVRVTLNTEPGPLEPDPAPCRRCGSTVLHFTMRLGDIDIFDGDEDDDVDGD